VIIARIAGFDSRADCGLRPPESFSRNVKPELGGCAGHWNGPATRLTKASPHSACRAFWRATQNYHMDRNNWVDVAYNIAVCPHGYALAGRGYGVRSAAQGTNDGNYRFMAIFYMYGVGEVPTTEMLEAAAWCVWSFRNQGAGREVRPHSYFKSTSCPGNPARTALASMHLRNVILWRQPEPPKPPVIPPTEEFIMASKEELIEVLKPLHDSVMTNRERANDAVRLGEATATYVVSLIRHEVGLVPDPVSDAIQVERLRFGKAPGHEGKYTLNDVRERLYQKYEDEPQSRRV
jgi:hypothetical protein